MRPDGTTDHVAGWNIMIPTVAEQSAEVTATAFAVDRLENGEYNERFIAIYMINILRVESAANALLALQEKTRNTVLISFINEALLLLKQSSKVVFR